MAQGRFSDDERNPVVDELESLINIKLKRIGRKKKFLLGSDNLYYCILGGREDWHEIPKEVMDQEEASSGSVYLVIARWLKTRIEMYGGPLKPLFDARQYLTLMKDGDYHLDLTIPENGAISIKQARGTRFPKIHEFNAPNISKFKSLSKEQQKELLKKAGIK